MQNPCSTLATALFILLAAEASRAQIAPPVILEIDTQNQVQYFQDASDIAKFATTAGTTPATLPKNFFLALVIADVVAVNGEPAGGTFGGGGTSLTFRPAPTAGQAIADTNRSGVNNYTFEILKADGTPIGTIVATGLGSGTAPPGAPPQAVGSNVPIVGGTGAFLGVRGQLNTGLVTAASRQASITEDPASRRINGGGKSRYVLQLFPMERPEVLLSDGAPAIFHADFTPVNAAKPAKSGELLIARATGLGPTVPGVSPGQPFPATIQPVNSPVEVTVGGQPAEVVNALGWPGTVGIYRVDFRVPSGVSGGTAAIQLRSAWIPGSEVKILLQ